MVERTYFPHYYTCPRCKAGEAKWISRDGDNRNLYRCDACGAEFGESALEEAARAHILRD